MGVARLQLVTLFVLSCLIKQYLPSIVCMLISAVAVFLCFVFETEMIFFFYFLFKKNSFDAHCWIALLLAWRASAKILLSLIVGCGVPRWWEKNRVLAFSRATLGGRNGENMDVFRSSNVDNQREMCDKVRTNFVFVCPRFSPPPSPPGTIFQELSRTASHRLIYSWERRFVAALLPLVQAADTGVLRFTARQCQEISKD